MINVLAYCPFRKALRIRNTKQVFRIFFLLNGIYAFFYRSSYIIFLLTTHCTINQYVGTKNLCLLFIFTNTRIKIHAIIAISKWCKLTKWGRKVQSESSPWIMQNTKRTESFFLFIYKEQIPKVLNILQHAYASKLTLYR